MCVGTNCKSVIRKEREIVLLFLFRMGNQCRLVCVSALATAFIATALALSGPEYLIERYDNSPGIYYESKGIAVLYNMMWKTIVYVDLQEIDKESVALRQYIIIIIIIFIQLQMGCHPVAVL